jgi:hypothetical protein
MQWWDIDLTGLFKGPQAAAGSALANCEDKSSAVHVFYIGPSQHVHQWLFTANSWAEQDVTNQAAPLPPETTVPAAANGTAFSSFVDNFGAHALYVAVDNNVNHVHELYLAWGDQILSPTVQAQAGSGLCSFVDGNGGAHVFCITSDGHVHQLSFGSGIWTDLDVTTAANSKTTATSGSALASFGDAYGYHLFYSGADGHLHQLYFDNVQWVDQDLTASTKGPQVAAGSGLSSFADTYGEHAFYVGSDQHVHHMNYAGKSWADQDLTLSTSGPQAAKASALSSFGDAYGDHVFYIGADQHIHQLYFDNNTWVDQDLTAQTDGGYVYQGIPVPYVDRAPLAATGSALSSLADSAGEQAFYIGADQHVHLLVYAPAPVGVQLPTGTGTGTGTGTVTVAVTCPVGSGEKNVPYSSSVIATGGTAPYTYSMNPSVPGLTMNSSTGTITGTPTTAGTFLFTVTATDATGATGKSGGCAIQITAGVTLGCAPAGTGSVGVAYSSSLVVSGGVAPYTYATSSGSLPPGLTLNRSTGVIAGTPTATGTFNFTATVTDSTGATATTTGCAIAIGGTFQINAIQFMTSAQTTGPDGPAINLGFAIFGSNQAVNSVQSPPGLYSVSVPSGTTQLTLDPNTVHNGFYICTNTGANASQAISVAFPQSAPVTIFVAYGNPIG